MSIKANRTATWLAMAVAGMLVGWLYGHAPMAAVIAFFVAIAIAAANLQRLDARQNRVDELNEREAIRREFQWNN